QLGVPFGALHVLRNGSARVTEVDVGRVALSGQRVMRLLRLRSTWFSIGELSLAGAQSTVACAHDVGGALLQQLTRAGWKTLRPVRAGARVWVAPRAYTIYRLTAGDVR